MIWGIRIEAGERRDDRFRMVKEEKIPTLVLPNSFIFFFSSDFTDSMRTPTNKETNHFYFHILKSTHQFIFVYINALG